MSKASDRAYRHIRGEILAGSLAPGEQLREEQLAEACGVSRTPVREALRLLEAEHFVRRSGSQRTFVNDWSFDEIEESFALRAMLEGRAAARAATRVAPDLIARLEGHNRAIAGSISGSALDVRTFLDHNQAFHALVLEAARSTTLGQLLAAIVMQPIVARTALHYDRQQVARSLAEHEELVLALHRGDPDWAEAVMVGHIRRAFHAYSDAYHSQSRAAAESA